MLPGRTGHVHAERVTRDLRRRRPSSTSADTEAVMAASRVFVAVIAASLAEVEDRVSVPQFRVLVMADAEEPLTLSAVAEGLGVHPSNATRTVDRLVEAGLMDRRDNPSDRRQVQLTLTTQGRQLKDEVYDHRRTAISVVLRRMSAEERRLLASAMGTFAQTAHALGVDQAPAATWLS
jgi:DNA-binding MarR family transcriptional regulator